jgi:hypothetical protein
LSRLEDSGTNRCSAEFVLWLAKGSWREGNGSGEGTYLKEGNGLGCTCTELNKFLYHQHHPNVSHQNNFITPRTKITGEATESSIKRIKIVGRRDLRTRSTAEWTEL